MAFANYTIELASEDGIFPSNWINITSYVKSLEITRGRDDVLSQVQTGTCSIQLKNDDGSFSPAYTLSPLYPNVSLMRAIRITGSPSSVTSYNFSQIATLTFTQVGNQVTAGANKLFFGYIQAIIPNPDPSVKETTIELSDGFAWLDLAKVTPTFVSGKMYDHVTAILNAAGWPTIARTIDAGALTFTPSYNEQSALQQLQSVVVDHEGGLLYMDGAGNIVAQDQNARFTGSYLSNVTTITDTDSVISLTAERPLRDIYNEIQITCLAGQILQTDATSVAKYGPRRLSLNANFLSGNDAEQWAKWLLSIKKDSKERLIVGFMANSSADLVYQALARELSDRIYFREFNAKTGTGGNVTTPVNGVGEYNIEAIRHTISNGGKLHLFEWQLSPVITTTRSQQTSSLGGWWTLDASQLTSGTYVTRLSYTV